jgi:hypothetical protein
MLAFNVYIAPALLQVKVPVVCLVTACVWGHREIRYTLSTDSTPSGHFLSQLISMSLLFFGPCRMLEIDDTEERLLSVDDDRAWASSTDVIGYQAKGVNLDLSIHNSLITANDMPTVLHSE